MDIQLGLTFEQAAARPPYVKPPPLPDPEPLAPGEPIDITVPPEAFRDAAFAMADQTRPLYLENLALLMAQVYTPAELSALITFYGGTGRGFSGTFHAAPGADELFLNVLGRMQANVDEGTCSADPEDPRCPSSRPSSVPAAEQP